MFYNLGQTNPVMVFKSKKALIPYKDASCLNCDHPFFGGEKFCPECGQENKGKHIPFNNFIYELFSGVISWDSKFWRTLVPLLLKPGRVSLNYTEGKRARYTNPFRFYLTISIVFFLLIGIMRNMDRLTTIATASKTPSITTLSDDVQKALESPNSPKISINQNDSLPPINAKVNIPFVPNIKNYIAHNKSFPEHSVDEALDHMKLPKTFWNRFIYSRVHVINHFDFKNDLNLIKQKGISYTSVSLFFLLPFFALFLKLFYIRKQDYSYVDHLVFVFHVQTVFFLLLLLLFPFIFIIKTDQPVTSIFLIMFLIYLFMALKTFYKQGYFKTFVKFCLLNMVYCTLSGIGLFIVAFAAFALF